MNKECRSLNACIILWQCIRSPAGLNFPQSFEQAEDSGLQVEAG
jgi:hypothetical protein